MLIYIEELSLVINLDNIEHFKCKDKYLHIVKISGTSHKIEYPTAEKARAAVNKILQAKRVKKEVIQI